MKNQIEEQWVNPAQWTDERIQRHSDEWVKNTDEMEAKLELRRQERLRICEGEK